jgi:uncharacterized protein YndB with AHSA1/START domain
VNLVSVEVEVEAPPEAVWEVVSDPRNLSHWDRHVESVEGIPASGLSAGVTYLTVMRFVTVRARVHAEVIEWQPPHLSMIRLSGLLEAVVTTTVEPLPGERSLLEHVVEYRFRGGPLGEFTARSLRMVGGPQFALRHGTLAQKREIESRWT